MTNRQRGGDLEIEQSLDFQRREWKAERVAWIAMAIVIIAAILGFFGGAGPFSTATAGADSAIRVEYYRFARFQSPSTLSVHLGPESLLTDTVTLWLDSAYLGGLRIEQISPEPESVEIGEGGLLYTFSVSDAAESADIIFSVTLERIGWREGHVGLASGASVRFHQLVYP